MGCGAKTCRMMCKEWANGTVKRRHVVHCVKKCLNERLGAQDVHVHCGRRKAERESTGSVGLQQCQELPSTHHSYAPVVRDTDARRRDTAFFRYIEVVPRVKLDPVRCSEGCSEGCNHQCTDEGGHVSARALDTFLEAGIGRLLEMKKGKKAPPNTRDLPKDLCWSYCKTRTTRLYRAYLTSRCS